ncbi:MAG: hypothetical protein Q7J45_00625 [bacterium]|nr:hypothetical protein [bacterium]
MSEHIHKEAFNLLCGELIGHGMSRQVFACLLRDDLVVKTESDSRRFQNVVEWETWQRVKDTPMAIHFAPCHSISPCGSVLVMSRTRPAGLDEFPKLMPAFLCDFKRTNYGVIAGKKGATTFVCHDYGTSLLFENGMTKRQRRAHWWDAF